MLLNITFTMILLLIVIFLFIKIVKKQVSANKIDMNYDVLDDEFKEYTNVLQDLNGKNGREMAEIYVGHILSKGKDYSLSNTIEMDEFDELTQNLMTKYYNENQINDNGNNINVNNLLFNLQELFLRDHQNYNNEEFNFAINIFTKTFKQLEK